MSDSEQARVILTGKPGPGRESTAKKICNCQDKEVLTMKRYDVDEISTLMITDLAEDSASETEKNKRILSNFLKEGKPYLIFVLPWKERITQGDEKRIEKFTELFLQKFENSFKIIVFTRSNELKENKESISDALQSSPKVLKNLLSNVNGRFLMIDDYSNSGSEENVWKQIKQICAKKVEHEGTSKEHSLETTEGNVKPKATSYEHSYETIEENDTDSKTDWEEVQKRFRVKPAKPPDEHSQYTTEDKGKDVSLKKKLIAFIFIGSSGFCIARYELDNCNFARPESNKVDFKEGPSILFPDDPDDTQSIKFGDEARKQVKSYYMEPPISTKRNTCIHFFNNFPAELYQMTTKEDNLFEIILLLTRIMKHMYYRVDKALKKDGISIMEADVLWIITKPALWNDICEKCLTKAIEQAEITNPLYVTEQDAILKYLMNLRHKRELQDIQDIILVYAAESYSYILKVTQTGKHIKYDPELNDVKSKLYHYFAINQGQQSLSVEFSECIERFKEETVPDIPEYVCFNLPENLGRMMKDSHKNNTEHNKDYELQHVPDTSTYKLKIKRSAYEQIFEPTTLLIQKSLADLNRDGRHFVFVCGSLKSHILPLLGDSRKSTSIHSWLELEHFMMGAFSYIRDILTKNVLH